MSRNLHSTEFKEQALIKVRERGTRSVQDVANDLHMPVGTLRKWLGKSNQVKSRPCKIRFSKSTLLGGAKNKLFDDHVSDPIAHSRRLHAPRRVV